MKKEDLIKYYSYCFNDSESFVEEYLDNYKEMSKILKTVFKNIKEMQKDYNIFFGDSKIMFENKKTKESYSLSIEF